MFALKIFSEVKNPKKLTYLISRIDVTVQIG